MPIFQPLGADILVIEHGGLVHIHFFPLGAGTEPIVFNHLIKERGAGIGGGNVKERNIERQLLRIINRLANRLLGLTGQPDNEVAPVHDAGRFGPFEGFKGLLFFALTVG